VVSVLLAVKKEVQPLPDLFSLPLLSLVSSKDVCYSFRSGNSRLGAADVFLRPARTPQLLYQGRASRQFPRGSGLCPGVPSCFRAVLLFDPCCLLSPFHRLTFRMLPLLPASTCSRIPTSQKPAPSDATSYSTTGPLRGLMQPPRWSTPVSKRLCRVFPRDSPCRPVSPPPVLWLPSRRLYLG
jgi:hypothetical protein